MVDVRPETARFQVDLDHDTRLRASVERLSRPDYETQHVLRDTMASDWPGDLAGRLLLSLARYARVGALAVERPTELAEAMLDGLAEHGYFGPELGDVVDEQQVACHGWVVAGLLQHYYVTADRRARAAALRVVDELLIPALERFDTYPRERDATFQAGGASGTAVRVASGWAISTDTWCVLLVLNGLVPAALETSRPDLVRAIERLADELENLDLLGQKVQLHAALAAARCLADYSAATNNRRYCRIATAVYDVYCRTARTLNYAPFNWFGRPDSWTESCAGVDSLGLAQTLYRLTGDQRYRDDAVWITCNALDFAERRDGSFGLDTITTPGQRILTPLEYDAFWCCTMRGAIGLLEAREDGIACQSPNSLLCEVVGDSESSVHTCRLCEISGTFGPDERPRIRLIGCDWTGSKS